MQRSAPESTMWTVVIIFLDPQSDGALCVVEALILVDLDLLFFQAAVEAFDVAVAFGVVVGGAAVRDAEPVDGFGSYSLTES